MALSTRLSETNQHQPYKKPEGLRQCLFQRAKQDCKNSYAKILVCFISHITTGCPISHQYRKFDLHRGSWRDWTNLLDFELDVPTCWLLGRTWQKHLCWDERFDALRCAKSFQQLHWNAISPSKLNHWETLGGNQRQWGGTSFSPWQSKRENCSAAKNGDEYGKCNYVVHSKSP